MFSKGLLWVTALMYLAYGIPSLYDPAIPAGFAGLTWVSQDAFIEIGAMYGGMSIGLGVFFMVGALRSDCTKASLILMVLALGGLGFSRTFLFALSDVPVTSYTFGAMGFEIVMAILGLAAYLLESKPKAAAS